MNRKKINLTLLEEYEKELRDRGISEVTLSTYLNDANRVLEALFAASSRAYIQSALDNQKYKSNYANIIESLKAITERRKP
jgi:hypothetical protein